MFLCDRLNTTRERSSQFAPLGHIVGGLVSSIAAGLVSKLSFSRPLQATRCTMGQVGWVLPPTSPSVGGWTSSYRILYTPTIMVWKTRATVLIDPHLFWVDHRICLAWIPNTRCWRCNLDSPHARPPFLSVLVHSGPRLHCYIDRSEPCKGRSSEKMLGWAVGHRKTSGFCKVYENIRKSNTWPSEEEYMKIISSPLVPP